METYQDLKGFEDKYEISINYPYMIRYKKTKIPVRDHINHKGDVYVYLNRVQYFKDRIIANHFIDNPNNLPCIEHINHNKEDNRIENLRWISQQENCEK